MGVTGFMQLLTRLILNDEFAVDASAVTLTRIYCFICDETRRKMVSLTHTHTRIASTTFERGKKRRKRVPRNVRKTA